MPTLKRTFLTFLLSTVLLASGVKGNSGTTATLVNVYATELYQNNVLTTDPVPNDISAVALDAHGGTVYVAAVTVTASFHNISVVQNLSFIEADSWVYVSESPYPNTLDSNSFNHVQINCTLTNGTTSAECIEIESGPKEDFNGTTTTHTTTFTGQVIPFTVIAGAIPTQTQNNAGVMIFGNRMFSSLSGVLLGIGILL